MRQRRDVGQPVKTAALAAILLLAGALAPAAVRAAQERYVIDPQHMTIAFLVSHVGYAKTLGQFTRAEGTFVFDPDAPMVRDISVSIDAASVDTHHPARDEHLRKPDFLWLERYPQITFSGTSAQQTGPRTGTVTGDLTLRGVTRPVTLDVTWNRSGAYPFGDLHWATGISARTAIRRSDFGMTYAVDAGLVGDEVEIILEFEAIRQDAKSRPRRRFLVVQAVAAVQAVARAWS
jgi:polyisoprenoid-binding protein YceI